MDVEILYIPQDKNQEANELAQRASEYKELEVKEHEYEWPDMATQDVPTIDQQCKLINYLEESSTKCSVKKLKYTTLEGDLYSKTVDGLLLKCVSTAKALRIMREVHEQLCDSNRSEPKMRWLIHRHDYFWPNISANYVNYAKV